MPALWAAVDGHNGAVQALITVHMLCSATSHLAAPQVAALPMQHPHLRERCYKALTLKALLSFSGMSKSFLWWLTMSCPSCPNFK